MNRIIIEYVRYYDMDGKNKTIGGIQTYIMNLAELFAKNNYEVIIIQPSNRDFEIKENGYKVKGIKCDTKKFSNISKTLIRTVEKNYDCENDILIFGSSVLVRKTRFKKSINIQHGIYWDVPFIKNFRNLPDTITILLRGVKAKKELEAVSNTSKTVCVDYNYINWYRCQTMKRNRELIAIPNFVNTTYEYCRNENDSNISIIFARRFEEIRGSRLITEVFKNILEKYKNVNITIAGSGKDEELLRRCFKKYSGKVNFIKYASEESIELHSKYDIAVVPSIGSEGTSLSLLEAMWAGCAVVCNIIGGMTNIILDEYNGIMVQPNAIQVCKAIENLIDNTSKRKYLSKNAKETVKVAFSRNIWDKKWMEVIKSF